MGGRENGNAMRFNRKVTFVSCTVGMYLPDGFDSWEDVYGKGIPYIYTYVYMYTMNIQTEIMRMKGTCRKGVFFKDRYLTLPYPRYPSIPSHEVALHTPVCLS